MTAQEKLNTSMMQKKHVCIGLDPAATKLPACVKNERNALFLFNKAIVDATHSTAGAYKMNFAFYESFGTAGFEQLYATFQYIKSTGFSGLMIADAKRGDIGSTSEQYADSVFSYFGADAITLHPYMGVDSLSPFLAYKDKLHFVLALTSNKGAQDFEKQILQNGKKLYQHVIDTVHGWNTEANCGLVFGATQFDELRGEAERLKSFPVLLPGVGAQGGDLAAVTRFFLTECKTPFLINASRSVIYKSGGDDFAEAATSEVTLMNKQIADIYSAI